MKHQPVKSSNIASIGYDADAKILEVTFIRGSTYKYTGIPTSLHKSLMAADSQGKFFNQHIKLNFPFSKQ